MYLVVHGVQCLLTSTGGDTAGCWAVETQMRLCQQCLHRGLKVTKSAIFCCGPMDMVVKFPHTTGNLYRIASGDLYGKIIARFEVIVIDSQKSRMGNGERERVRNGEPLWINTLPSPTQAKGVRCGAGAHSSRLDNTLDMYVIPQASPIVGNDQSLRASFMPGP